MDRKYKICHICSYYETPIFSDLVQHQIDFTLPRVFYYQHFKHPFQNSDEPYVDKCPCYKKWERLFFHIKQGKAIQEYKTIYQISDIELNFAHSLFTNGYVAYQIKQSRNIPYIVAIQNTDINVFFKYHRMLYKEGIMILREAEKIILSSESYKETLLRKYIPKKYRDEIAKKIAVIPYGINDFYSCNRFTSNKHIDDKIKILSVGQVNKNKNQLSVCKILKKLRISNKKIELKIIGECKDKRIMNKIKKYPFVQYYPYMDKQKLLKQYREADIFVLTSKTETFGLVYAEALSQGIPVIYTQNQGFDKQFQEGLVGFHTSGKARDLKRKIARIVVNYNKIQKNCAESSKNFEWKKIETRYLEIYREILE